MVFIMESVFAQQVNGCLVDGELYPVSTFGVPNFTPYASCTIGAGWTFVSSAGNTNQINTCNAFGGVYGSYQCPIDKGSLGVLVCSMILGCYAIRIKAVGLYSASINKNKLH